VNWFVLGLDDVFLFLNGLFYCVTDFFSVRSLLLGEDLFWVRLGRSYRDFSEVGGFLEKEDYDLLRGRGGSFVGEIPEYQDYFIMFLASGVLKPDRWDRISEKIIGYLRRNPLEGDRLVFFSFDTSALRRRYYTLVSNLIAKSRVRGLVKPGFVASLGVLRELSGFDNKYGDREVSDMCGTFGLSVEVLGEFSNQLKLGDRLQKVGFVEYRKMSKREYFEELEGEAGDKNIIESLEKFSKNRNVDVIVFSEDSKFVDEANAFKLKGVRLDRPKDLPETVKLQWEDVAQLLYTAAVFYGALEISKVAKIYGVWKGKKSEYWNLEQIKILAENLELQKFLEENYRIISQKRTKKR
jgi:hypothetical protein